MMAFEVSSVRTINQPQETRSTPHFLHYHMAGCAYLTAGIFAVAIYYLASVVCEIHSLAFDAEMAISIASASVVGLVGFGGVTFFCYKYAEKHFKKG
jgi:hypothetical protein